MSNLQYDFYGFQVFSSKNSRGSKFDDQIMVKFCLMQEEKMHEFSVQLFIYCNVVK